MRENVLSIIHEAQKYYYQVELPQVKRDLQALREAHWEEFSRSRELYLSQNIDTLRRAESILSKAYEEASRLGWSFEDKRTLRDSFKRCQSLLKYNLGEMKWLKGKGSGVTDEMVESARNFPIEQLVEVGRNLKAKCCNPDHDDRHPSMLVKNNYAYCFSCGYVADPIKVAMDVNGWDFVEAVRNLS